ncbi:IS5 family transposase [Streptomyces sp. NPDC001231]|uniref:IS5 family transposase n=1 Tax=unclassified Streptomyces TaxID=2593676 RepID=UPI003682121E
MLHSGIQREYLPQERGFGSGVTCWRRLAAWNEAGVWGQLHVLLLKKPRAGKQLDCSRAVIDSSHVGAARRGPKTVEARSTAHVRATSITSLSTEQGIPLAVSLTGGNRVRSRRGPRRRRRAGLHADKGYDYDGLRRWLRSRNITPRIARKGIESSQRLGRHCWTVERTVAWLAGCRRLHRRYERKAEHFLAFAGIAADLIRYRRLGPSRSHGAEKARINSIEVSA